MIITTLVGCGGSGGESVSIKSAKLIDASIKGVSFSTDTMQGITDENGTFFYKSNETRINFKIGTALLAEYNLSKMPDDNQLLVSDLLELQRENSTDSRLVQLLQFLQSLDSDENATNGIVIEEKISLDLNESNLNFLHDNLSTQEINKTLISLNRSMVSQREAVIHFEQTLNSEFSYDVDTIAPLFISENSWNLQENSAESFLIKASDANSIEFSLSKSDADAFDINSSTGVLRFKNLPDYEQKAEYSFVINASDEKGNTATQNFTINIENINDNQPLFSSKDLYSFEENRALSLKLSANDSDNDSLTFSLLGEDANSFDINSSTGVVNLKTLPDYELKNNYHVEALVSDGVFQNELNITIDITNIADVVAMLSSFDGTIDENLEAGVEVGSVTIVNSGDSSINSFTLSDTRDFSIDVNGVIYTNKSLDYETQAVYNLRVYATNGAGKSQSVAVDIKVHDIYEVQKVQIPTLVVIMNWNDYREDDASVWQTKIFDKTQNSVNRWYDETTLGEIEFVPVNESFGVQNDGVITVEMHKNHPGGSDDIAFRDVEIRNAIRSSEVVNSMDFALLDKNGDGVLNTKEIQIIFIVAGGEESFGDSASHSIWAHTWAFDSSSTLKVDGVYLMRYYGSLSNSGSYTRFGANHGTHKATIGVIAHELGHGIFFLEDLYDDGGGSGLGYYDIMSGGSWAQQLSDIYPGETPTQYSAFSKIDALLDMNVTEVSSSGEFSIKCDSRDLIKLKTSKTDEYFLIECRDTSKENSDISLSREDFSFTNRLFTMIYHVDTFKSNNNQDGIQTPSNHYKVAIVEKDTSTLMTSFENIRADFNDVYTQGDVVESQRLKLYNGSETNYRIEITSQDYSAKTMSIKISK